MSSTRKSSRSTSFSLQETRSAGWGPAHMYSEALQCKKIEWGAQDDHAVGCTAIWTLMNCRLWKNEHSRGPDLFRAELHFEIKLLIRLLWELRDEPRIHWAGIYSKGLPSLRLGSFMRIRSSQASTVKPDGGARSGARTWSIKWLRRN